MEVEETVVEEAEKTRTEVKKEGRSIRGFLHHPLRFVYLILFVVFVLLTGGSIVIRNMSKAIDNLTDQADRIEKTADNTDHVLAVTSEENRQYFDTTRQLIITQDQEQRKALLDQLRSLTFTNFTTTTAPVKGKSTTTTSKSKITTVTSTTTTTRPPTTTSSSSTTTTTRAPPSTSCITTPAVNICR